MGFKAAMMVAGISDWGMLLATGELGTLDAALSGSCGWEGTGPHPHDQASPISFAPKIRTPVLIVNGEDDTNVPVGRAIYFHRALGWFGAEHELVIYPREGHGFVEHNHQLDLLRRAAMHEAVAVASRWPSRPGWRLILVIACRSERPRRVTAAASSPIRASVELIAAVPTARRAPSAV